LFESIFFIYESYFLLVCTWKIENSHSDISPPQPVHSHFVRFRDLSIYDKQRVKNGRPIDSVVRTAFIKTRTDRKIIQISSVRVNNSRRVQFSERIKRITRLCTPFIRAQHEIIDAPSRVTADVRRKIVYVRPSRKSRLWINTE